MNGKAFSPLVFLSVLFVVAVPPAGFGPTPTASCAEADAKAAPTPTGWRGDGTGRYPEAAPVLEWNEAKKTNILWSVELGSGMNYSCPIVVGRRVLVSAEKDRLICIDRHTGKILWTVNSRIADLPEPVEEKAFNTSCGYSTPTAASDGERVYVVYGTGIVAAYDLDGKRAWIKYFPYAQATEDGRSASPLLADGRLVVSLGHVFALDPETGDVVWKAEKATVGYGSPVAARIGETVVAITPTGAAIRVRDGKVLTTDLGVCQYASPVVFRDRVFFVADFGEIYRLPAKVSEEMDFELLCDVDLSGEFYASPLYHDGLLYCVNNNGIFFVVDAQTGETLLEQRLGIPSAIGEGGMTANLYPSPTLAGEHILLGNDIGHWLALAPGREFKEVAKNVMAAGSGACPVASGAHLYLRGGKSLYCIGK